MCFVPCGNWRTTTKSSRSLLAPTTKKKDFLFSLLGTNLQRIRKKTKKRSRTLFSRVNSARRYSAPHTYFICQHRSLILGQSNVVNSAVSPHQVNVNFPAASIHIGFNILASEVIADTEDDQGRVTGQLSVRLSV